MLTNSIFFTFQSIFILFAFCSLITSFISYFIDANNETILIIAFLLNVLIIYLINLFKTKEEISITRFMFVSLVCWLLIILVGLVPMLELIESKSFNEKLFFSTSLATTTGFDLFNYDKGLILSIWISIIQLIGALYTIIIFIM